MPWSFRKSRRRNTVPARKQSYPNPSAEFLHSPSQLPQPSQLSNLGIIPPEIWLQILDFVPFETLWFLRLTCQLFNKLAIVRAWQVIRDTKVGVRTFFDSEHDPLSYVSATSELLYPVLPQNISSDIKGTIIDDPVFVNTTMVTWRVSTEQPTDCEDMRMSYRPLIVEIRFGTSTAGYRIERPQPMHGPFKDLSRKENWTAVSDRKSDPKFRSAKLGKIFSSKSRSRSHLHWPIYKGLPPRWIVQYLAKYGHGRNDNGQLVSQLVALTLIEVSLPVTQVVCTLIDALKYGDQIVEEDPSND